MGFITDKQTLEDLNLLGRYRSNSIFNLFNHTVTRGGDNLLSRMFAEPLTSEQEINKRRDIISFFQSREIVFPLTREEFDCAEQYLSNTHRSGYISSMFSNLRRKFLKLVANDKELDEICSGYNASVNLFIVLKEMFTGLMQKDSVYAPVAGRAIEILNRKDISEVITGRSFEEIPFSKYMLFDHRLRSTGAAAVMELLDIVYAADAYISVAETGRRRGFNFAEAGSGNGMSFNIEGLYHPCVPDAIANDLILDNEKSVLFLTGANMAGKSTLMKAFGVTLYLAHMGFPLPVSKMSFNVQEGMYTSINVPDNLNMGYSHFYAEVVRVKNIATEVSSGKRLTIMFDELFKGTNVKDAYDATVAVTEAFSRSKKCAFIVSTHIMEAGITLRESCGNIIFRFLPTRLNGNKPEYTYKMEDGISDDRHGMRIIQNERIIETILGKN